MKSLFVRGAALLAIGCAAAGCSDAEASPSTSTTTVTSTSTSSSMTPSTVVQTSTVTQTASSSATPSETATTPAPAGEAKPSCGSQTAEQAFKEAVGKLDPPFPDRSWVIAPEQKYSSFDPCQDLSYLEVDTEGGTGSSPRQMLLFHRGEYLGTVFAKPYSFGTVVERTSPAAIKVTFKFVQGNDANANPTGRAVSTFTWNEGQQKVVQSGDIPPTVKQ